jgi:transposase
MTAPAHMALSVHQYLAKNNMAMVPIPLYSPDVVPIDFFLFPRLKLKLNKGKRFDDILEIQQKSKEAVQQIMK